jgi:hypothetical protein
VLHIGNGYTVFKLSIVDGIRQGLISRFHQSFGDECESMWRWKATVFIQGSARIIYDTGS